MYVPSVLLFANILIYHNLRKIQIKNVPTVFRTASFMLADDMLGSSNPGLKNIIFTKLQTEFKQSYHHNTMTDAVQTGI